MVVFPAHVKKVGTELVTQSLREHSENTAKYASQSLKKAGLEHVGLAATKIHDGGKGKKTSEEYMEKGAEDPNSVRRGSVNHTFAGCRYLLERYHKDDASFLTKLTAELMAYAVGAHHSLFDCVDANHQSGFLHRMQKEGIDYASSIRAFFEQVTTPEEMDALFRQAEEELGAVNEKIIALARKSDDCSGEGFFYYSLLARLILSALIDADCRDTAEFMEERPYPNQPEGKARQDMWQSCVDFMERKLAGFSRETPIQKARWSISDQCAAFAQKPSGIYRLNVPTGSGKTLSSLRYALHHVQKWNKSRIIFTSSLLSILDQNAVVIRSYIPENVQVLEHHSNVVQPKDEEEKIAWKMMTEQYSAPIIITTLVQLLDTLFSGRSACIRRFQALLDSVIVIDEVQTVPNNMLTLFNLAINFLTEVCGATVILCSATQPALGCAVHPMRQSGEMVPYDEAIWSAFCRTEIQDAGGLRFEEIPDFVLDKLQTVQSLLVVCNTKAEAMSLFGLLSNTQALCVHLSASMCMAHRREVLDRVQKVLDGQKNGTCTQKVICVSTQVIEAGVDISFGCVIRLAAGLDNVVQAAGRCNRNGEADGVVPVYIIRCVDEKLRHLEEIQKAKNALEVLLNAFSNAPEQFGGSLTTDKSIERYYRALYKGMEKNYQDDYIPKLGYSIFELLSQNRFYLQGTNFSQQFVLNQAFKTAGNAFTVFEQDTTDVLVPYGEEGQKISNKLFEMDKQYTVDFKALDALLQKAKPYTVSVYRYQMDRLEACGGIQELFQGRIRVLLNGFYDDNVGLFLKQSTGNLWEV